MSARFNLQLAAFMGLAESDSDIIKHALALALEVGRDLVEQCGEPVDRGVWMFCERVLAAAEDGDLSAIRKEIAELADGLCSGDGGGPP